MGRGGQVGAKEPVRIEGKDIKDTEDSEILSSVNVGKKHRPKIQHELAKLNEKVGEDGWIGVPFQTFLIYFFSWCLQHLAGGFDQIVPLLHEARPTLATAIVLLFCEVQLYFVAAILKQKLRFCVRGELTKVDAGDGDDSTVNRVLEKTSRLHKYHSLHLSVSLMELVCALLVSVGIAFTALDILAPLLEPRVWMALAPVATLIYIVLLASCACVTYENYRRDSTRCRNLEVVTERDLPHSPPTDSGQS